MKTLRSLCLLAVSATLGLGLAACVIKATDTSKARMPATLWITSPIVREGRAMAASQAPATIRPKEQKLAATNRHIEDSVPSPAAGSQHPTREAPVRYDRLTRATAVKSPTDSPLMPRMDLVIRADNLPEQMPVSVAATEIKTPTAETPAAMGVRVVAALLPAQPPHMPELLPAPLPAPPPSLLPTSAPNAPTALERSAPPASGWIIVPGDNVAKVPEVADWMLDEVTRPDPRPAFNTPIRNGLVGGL
jgi:hypothetical protein